MGTNLFLSIWCILSTQQKQAFEFQFKGTLLAQAENSRNVVAQTAPLPPLPHPPLPNTTLGINNNRNTTKNHHNTQKVLQAQPLNNNDNNHLK